MSEATEIKEMVKGLKEAFEEHRKEHQEHHRLTSRLASAAFDDIKAGTKGYGTRINDLEVRQEKDDRLKWFLGIVAGTLGTLLGGALSLTLAFWEKIFGE